MLLLPRFSLLTIPFQITLKLQHNQHADLLDKDYSQKFPYRKSISMRLSVIHFQGFSIRHLSCYTLLRWFQLPWPHQCCLYAKTLFCFLIRPNFDTLTFRLVQPTSPVLLTKNGPLDTLFSHSKFTKATWRSDQLEVWEYVKDIASLNHPIIISTRSNNSIKCQLSWEKLRSEPATRRFD